MGRAITRSSRVSAKPIMDPPQVDGFRQKTHLKMRFSALTILRTRQLEPLSPARISGRIGLGLVLRTIAARAFEFLDQLLAPCRDRLRRRLDALFDPLHQAIERCREFRRALPGVRILVCIGLYQTVAPTGGMNHFAIGRLHFDRHLRIVDRMNRQHRNRQLAGRRALGLEDIEGLRIGVKTDHVPVEIGVVAGTLYATFMFENALRPLVMRCAMSRNNKVDACMWRTSMDSGKRITPSMLARFCFWASVRALAGLVIPVHSSMSFAISASVILASAEMPVQSGYCASSGRGRFLQ